MLFSYIKIVCSLSNFCENWYLVVFSKLFNLKIKILEIKGGLKIYLNSKIPPASISMLNEIFGLKLYNPKGFEIEKNNIVFDIGANAGYFSLYAGSLDPSIRVYAFEPVPRLYKMILESKRINNLQNIFVNNIVISNKIGEIHFNISEIHDGCHSLYIRDNTDKKILVKTNTLENFCLENKIKKIDFLKLDCEGAEYEIFLNLNLDFLKSKIVKISMEYHDDIVEGMNHEILEDFFKRHNFEVRINAGYLYARNLNL